MQVKQSQITLCCDGFGRTRRGQAARTGETLDKLLARDGCSLNCVQKSMFPQHSRHAFIKLHKRGLSTPAQAYLTPPKGLRRNPRTTFVATLGHSEQASVEVARSSLERFAIVRQAAAFGGSFNTT